MFANTTASPTSKAHSSNLHDIHPDMKTINSSISVAKPTVRRFILAAALGVAIAVSAVPASHAAILVFDVNTASIAATSSFNLTDEAMIVRTTPFATINGYFTTGFAAYAWNGFGIRSSVAATDPNGITSLGIANNADFGLATFFGVPVTGGAESLARYTYYGDANLDGLVDATDYAYTDAGYFGGGYYWGLGDFDYSGVVDATDYAVLDAGYFGQGAPFASSLTAAPTKGGVVPEPSSIGLIAIGALALLKRRRNN